MNNDFSKLFAEFVKSYQNILDAIQKASFEWSVTTQADCRLHVYRLNYAGSWESGARAEINGIVGIDVQNMRKIVKTLKLLYRM